MIYRVAGDAERALDSADAWHERLAELRQQDAARRCAGAARDWVNHLWHVLRRAWQPIGWQVDRVLVGLAKLTIRPRRLVSILAIRAPSHMRRRAVGVVSDTFARESGEGS
jgi:hypothetical protein